MQEIHKIEPASEEWWLFRKPISETTITDNVLRWGTGGLNIDRCRVTHDEPIKPMKAQVGGDKVYGQSGRHEATTELKASGRWPANVVHDGSDEVVGMFPDTLPAKQAERGKGIDGSTFRHKSGELHGVRGHNDSGGSAARFFYSTKTNARHSKISQGKPMYTLHHGDCLEVLQTLPDSSVDSIVTDPPAGIAFMNMQWDKDKGGRDVWIAWMEKVAKECLRVMKPGGHALVWSLPRTSHWTGTAWENAGWEPRDKIYFLFGTGFPKSMNIGKQIDKMRGAERKIIGNKNITGLTPDRENFGSADRSNGKGMGFKPGQIPITVPATEEAKQWDGWGTGLKPASEEWWLFRKPISETTITDNVLCWGTGGLNIDGCRVETQDRFGGGSIGVGWGKIFKFVKSYKHDGWVGGSSLGRWPANVVHDGSDEVVGMFPDVKAGTAVRKNVGVSGAGWKSVGYADTKNDVSYNDSGSAARFFYGAKASVRDRDEGLSNFTKKRSGGMSATLDGSMLTGSGNERTTTRANIHPTVKSTELMRYLCRLITPPHGIVLDPFTGSGSTGKGALKEGFQFIGIEMDEEYYTIARARLDHVLQQKGSS